MASPRQHAAEKHINDSYYDQTDHHFSNDQPGAPGASPYDAEVLDTRVPLAVDNGDCGPDLSHLSPKQAQTFTCRSILMLFFGARASPGAA